ncbi:hypothetical protein SKAU_G00104890 [Synaphobranchus kaupii]|uniref:Uncharacterized protein n=1 Tax=Synaphobranchus kaupii TaxID=118154 RepID=A0A9Q1G0A0_SYNKA|nr:hypothetical protein SKAU_G00104890 [Synaphobranchus kaupii]
MMGSERSAGVSDGGGAARHRVKHTVRSGLWVHGFKTASGPWQPADEWCTIKRGGVESSRNGKSPDLSVQSMRSADVLKATFQALPWCRKIKKTLRDKGMPGAFPLSVPTCPPDAKATGQPLTPEPPPPPSHSEQAVNSWHRWDGSQPPPPAKSYPPILPCIFNEREPSWSHVTGIKNTSITPAHSLQSRAPPPHHRSHPSILPSHYKTFESR